MNINKLKYFFMLFFLTSFPFLKASENSPLSEIEILFKQKDYFEVLQKIFQVKALERNEKWEYYLNESLSIYGQRLIRSPLQSDSDFSFYFSFKNRPYTNTNQIYKDNLLILGKNQFKTCLNKSLEFEKCYLLSIELANYTQDIDHLIDLNFILSDYLKAKLNNKSMALLKPYIKKINKLQDQLTKNQCIEEKLVNFQFNNLSNNHEFIIPKCIEFQEDQFLDKFTKLNINKNKNILIGHFQYFSKDKKNAPQIYLNALASYILIHGLSIEKMPHKLIIKNSMDIIKNLKDNSNLREKVIGEIKKDPFLFNNLDFQENLKQKEVFFKIFNNNFPEIINYFHHECQDKNLRRSKNKSCISFTKFNKKLNLL